MQRIMDAHRVTPRLARLDARDIFQLEAGICLYNSDINEAMKMVKA